MSYTCSQGPGEVFGLASCSGTVASEPSKSSHTRKRSSLPGSATAASRVSRFFQTLDVSMVDPGADELTSWLAGFHARTSALQEKVLDSTESDPASGEKWQGSLARFDRDTFSWKTHQRSLLEDLGLCSVTWPRSGMTAGGLCWELPMLALRTSGTASGSWPAPTATDYKSESMSFSLVAKRQSESSRVVVRLTEFLQRRIMPTPTAGNNHSGGRLDEWGGSTNPFRGTEIGRLRVNPFWVETLMGWPTGSTDLKPLAMDKYLEWLRQHSPS